MKFAHYLLVVVLTILNAYVFGQNTTDPTETFIRCGTDAYHAELMQNPAFASKFETLKAEKHAASSEKINCSSGVITIPIAVHYGGGIDNSNYACLLAAAQSQVQVLNEDFGAYNTDITNFCNIAMACPDAIPAAALSTGSCIQFCLATQNHPDCSGIANGSPAITVDQYSWTIGPAAPCWSGYLNIFVEDNLGILGLAPLLGGNNPNGNGVQVAANAFGGPGISCTSGVGINNDGIYNLGRTATHEIGHYLGLNHVFDGCGVGDGIADTPSQSEANYGCPTFNTTTCTSNAENSCATQDFYFNFMDYVNDQCMYMFTDDQASLMYQTVLPQSKWASNTCADDDEPDYDPIYTAPCTTAPPVANFEYTGPTTVCENNATLLFTDLSENLPNSYSWTFTGAGAFPTTSTAQNPIITVNASGTLVVNMMVGNNAGTSTSSNNYEFTVLPIGHPDCPACINAINDGGFEGSVWNESSLLGYQIITTDFPQSGTSSAWLGGAPNEQSFVYQTMTIPTNSTSAILTYSYYITSDEGCDGASNDAGGLVIDEDQDGLFSILTSIDICTNTATGAWITTTYDLSAFAGQSFDIGFYTVTNTNNTISNFYVDDVSIEVCTEVSLAVELLNFIATPDYQKIDISWNLTNNDNSNNTFSLLKSINPTSGFELLKEFEILENETSFLFEDEQVNSGITYYYQLVQTETDGSTFESEIVSAKINGIDMKVTPNPVSNQLRIHLPGENLQSLNISIIDIVGKTMLTRTIDLNGNASFDLDVSNFATGVYLLNASADGVSNEVIRFVKR